MHLLAEIVSGASNHPLNVFSSVTALLSPALHPTGHGLQSSIPGPPLDCEYFGRCDVFSIACLCFALGPILTQGMT